MPKFTENSGMTFDKKWTNRAPEICRNGNESTFRQNIGHSASFPGNNKATWAQSNHINNGICKWTSTTYSYCSVWPSFWKEKQFCFLFIAKCHSYCFLFIAKYFCFLSKAKSQGTPFSLTLLTSPKFHSKTLVPTPNFFKNIQVHSPNNSNFIWMKSGTDSGP